MGTCKRIGIGTIASKLEVKMGRKYKLNHSNRKEERKRGKRKKSYTGERK